MKATRHHAREIALQILYRYDSHTQAAAPSAAGAAPESIALARDLDQHFRHFEVPQSIREFCAELVSGTLRRQSEIDQQIESLALNWKVNRMPLIDRNLLRMSIHELLNFRDTPPSVIIDEAVELAKTFGSAETAAFVNGILDNLRKQHRPNDPVKP